MSKHNYSQYSNKNKPNNNSNPNPNRNVQQRKPEVVKPVETVETARPSLVKETSQVARPSLVKETSQVARPSLVKETVETVTLPAVVKGTVAHCSKLNVREKPVVNSEIVCVLNVTSEIEIDVEKSTENWFYVRSATGAEGYCMKEYIDARL